MHRAYGLLGVHNTKSTSGVQNPRPFHSIQLDKELDFPVHGIMIIPNI